MPVTENDVRRFLEPDEPRYEQAASQLGEDALPQLETLVRDADPPLAAKAAYLAGLIGGRGAIAVLESAAAREDEPVRAAAAAAAARMPADHGAPVLERLLNDDAPEVRRIAVESSGAEPASAVQRALERVASEDPHPYLRQLAARTLGTGPGRRSG